MFSCFALYGCTDKTSRVSIITVMVLNSISKHCPSKTSVTLKLKSRQIIIKKLGHFLRDAVENPELKKKCFKFRDISTAGINVSDVSSRESGSTWLKNTSLLVIILLIHQHRSEPELIKLRMGLEYKPNILLGWFV